ncbi:PAS domain S-box-containing protein [Caulobacter ginsengisoli]|uniref:histidine kinase n=1 Tax=Caulobacter ginsengisoli TaxID=400775 RepID=A0ABU0J031_9CAUL|nr:ATP-binding protein [Caulobacter ginsengisoli]MDQ0466965.1 PAS domain S-box-containing protein [Caulobacter ginsengisoli]
MSLDAGYVTVAQVRGKELRTRLVAGLIIAGVTWAVAPSLWVPVWLAALYLAQIPDQLVGRAIRGHRQKDGGPLPARLRAAAVFCAGFAATVYASIVVVMWTEGGEPGRILAMMLLAGGLLHVSLHMHHVRAVMIATLAPYVIGWMGLPLLPGLAGDSYSPTVMLGMMAAGGLYLLHLVTAVRGANRTTLALRAATLAAEGREASVRLLFEDNPVAVLLVDPLDLAIIDANAAACRQFGRTREVLLALNTLDLGAEEDRALARRLHAAGEFKQASSERVWRMHHADGSDIFVRPASQYVWSDGRQLALTAMVDVSERYRAEQTLIENAQALERARDEADAANRAKSEFLANMSHEIRTPLNGVVGMADVLARTPLIPAQAEMVETIRSSGATLERLLSDVLDLARIESGHQEIRPEAFHLGAAVRDVAALSTLRAREKGVALVLDLSPGAETVVQGDITRLKQILTNLLSNAVKFTEVGEVRLTVGGPDGEQQFLFTVSDTGVGFDPAGMDRVFGRFQQADGSISRRFGGTGLGLAISRELAQRMGGALEAASVPGRGSTFTLTLTLPAGELAAQNAQPRESGLDRPARVLLADDHPINRKVVELMLAQSGAELVSVGDGRQALAALEGGVFDVILMDMQMPVMDGLAATRAIRAREAALNLARTPVIMLTANGMPEHIEAGIAAGADGHLTKPITAEALFEAVFRALEAPAVEAAA